MPDRTDRGLVLPHLRSWRFHAVLSQADLAERSGVSKPTIARAEAGERITFTNIHKLAAALGVSAQQLLYEEPFGITPAPSGGASSRNDPAS